ncbi:MAG: hypothetical protein ABI083_17350, partial [Lapillicoccus sp.]
LSTAYALDRSIAFEAERRPARHASDLPGVVLTADSRTRTGDLVRLRDLTEAAGSVVLGVVHVKGRSDAKASGPRVFRKGQRQR